MSAITIKEISALSKEGRVVIDVSPTGVGYEDGTNMTIYPAREAGEGCVFFDPNTGRVWWGSMTTLRILRDSAEPLEGGTVVKDAANAAYQRYLLGH